MMTAVDHLKAMSDYQHDHPDFRELMDEIVLVLHRTGKKLPHSTEVAKIVEGIMGTSSELLPLDDEQTKFVFDIYMGLSKLTQLCLANERK